MYTELNTFGYHNNSAIIVTETDENNDVKINVGSTVTKIKANVEIISWKVYVMINEKKTIHKT